MKFRLIALYLVSLINLTIQRHLLLLNTNGSLIKSTNLANRLFDKLSIEKLDKLSSRLSDKFSIIRLKKPTTSLKLLSNRSIPIYLIKKSRTKNLDNLAFESRNVEQYANHEDSNQENNHEDRNYEINQVNHIDNQMINLDQKSVDNNQIDNQVDRIHVNNNEDVILNRNLDENTITEFNVPAEDDQVIAKRMDNMKLMRKLGLTSLLATSQRRISPLNKIILGLIGPKLIKLQVEFVKIL